MNTLRQISRLPAARIAAAIVLSLLVHAALLLGPNLVELAPIAPPLPPLMAKLEPLPTPTPKKVHKKAHRAPEPAPSPPEPAAPAEKAATDQAADAEAAQPAEPEPPAEAPAEPARPAHPLPRHAQLTFIAYKGVGFSIGEARHRLDIDENGRYTLQVGMNTTGIASLFKTFEMNQQSIGTVDARGLHPEQFSEVRITAKGRQTLSAAFGWQDRQLTFSSGNAVPLPEQAQDMLSFLYQFSQLPLDQAELSVHVSNGKKLESYRVEIGAEEQIDTRLGKLRALPIRKLHAPGEEGLEIWLGLEYRLLPVQVRQIDRNGEIAGQMVVSEIRVSEE